LTEEVRLENDSDWRKFLKRHWKIFAVFVVAVIIAGASAFYVFLWFVGDAQSTAMVPTTLGSWTMGHMVTFFLHLLLWELIFIGIPVIIGAIVGWQWWKRLPEEEKKEYRFFGKRSRTTGGSGGISLLFSIAFAIKVYIDGNWNVPIATWTLDYVVYSMLTILLWGLVIFGIPATIGVIWWIRHELSKKP
jgi:hypothetical protein